MEPSSGQVSLQEDDRERKQARERRTAAWILVLAMAISAIVAMAITIFLQRP